MEAAVEQGYLLLRVRKDDCEGVFHLGKLCSEVEKITGTKCVAIQDGESVTINMPLETELDRGREAGFQDGYVKALTDIMEWMEYLSGIDKSMVKARCEFLIGKKEGGSR